MKPVASHINTVVLLKNRQNVPHLRCKSGARHQETVDSLIQVGHWIRKTTSLWPAHPTFSEWSALRSWSLHHIKRNIPSSSKPSPVLLESPKMPSPLPSTQSSHALKKITTLPDCFFWQLRLALTPPPAPVSNGGALWGSALLLFTLYTHDTERTHEILKYDERRRHERVDY